MLAELLRRLIIKLLPPWYYPPPNFQPFDQSGLLATPAVAAPAATVLTIKVPTGWRMVIRRLSHNIVGPGFVQGSGQLIWSLAIDNSPVKGYAQMLTEFGDVKTGPRLTDGILAQSAQILTYNVTNVGYIAAGTNIVVTVSGWFYPEPRYKGMAQ